MEVIKSILTGTLCPWSEENNQSEAYFKAELSENKLIQEDIKPNYQIKFLAPEFSFKIKYYIRIIDNEIAKCLNAFYKDNLGVPENLFLYRFREIKNDIFDSMKYSNNIIKQENYELSVLTSKHTDFSIDKEHKESTFILHYLITSLIRCYLEIQSQFSQYIDDDDKLTIEDCYTNILQIQAPENTFIKEIQTIDIVDEKPTDEKPVIEANRNSILSFTYIHYQNEPLNINDLYTKLKETNRINKETTLPDFKRVFTGKEIENPIVWTGALSDLTYLMKQMVNSNQVLRTPNKHSIWEVVVNCFVDENKNIFDKSRLRRQQIPKQNINELKIIANLLT